MSVCGHWWAESITGLSDPDSACEVESRQTCLIVTSHASFHITLNCSKPRKRDLPRRSPPEPSVTQYTSCINNQCLSQLPPHLAFPLLSSLHPSIQTKTEYRLLLPVTPDLNLNCTPCPCHATCSTSHYSRCWFFPSPTGFWKSLD